MLLARSSPGGLALATDPTFQYPAHIELLDSVIVDAIAGVLPPRIIIEAPPRHGKSILYSKWLPAWYLGTFPGKRVMFGSYEADFAASWGAAARGILEEFGPTIFGVGVNQASRARYRWDALRTWEPGDAAIVDPKGSVGWNTVGEGGMIAAGVGGSYTGRGGNLVLLDDPIKNRMEAESQLKRDRIWEWWQSAIYTRLEPGAIIVVIMARWHEDDLVGRLLQAEANGGEEWHRVRLPALAEENDVLGREPGEALWPARYDEDDFARMRQPGGVGPYAFEGLYQCNPSPPEGGILKRGWWGSYAPLAWPQGQEVIQSWDMAFKDTKDSDYVVGQVWLRDQANKYLLAQIRARLSFTDTLDAVQALTDWTSERFDDSHAVLVEDKANGTAVMNALRNRISGLIGINPKESKEARAHAISPQVEAGNVYLPAGSIPCPADPKDRWSATPTEVLIEECAAFPHGSNDDMTDSLTQALNRLARETSAGTARSGGYDSRIARDH